MRKPGCNQQFDVGPSYTAVIKAMSFNRGKAFILGSSLPHRHYACIKQIPASRQLNEVFSWQLFDQTF
jgi:hypothetical protein